MVPGQDPDPLRRALQRPLVRFAVWMPFGLGLFQSITVTVRWWTGEVPDPAPWEWLWIGLFPVWIGVYLRYFSVLGCGPRCAPGDQDSPRDPSR
jgi:hypothetical protein